jgi:hypothetical protein
MVRITDRLEIGVSRAAQVEEVDERSDMAERRVGVVMMTSELLAQWLRQGNKVPAVQVDRGMPPDAQIIAARYEPDLDCVSLLVRSDEFPPLAEVVDAWSNAPVIEISVAIEPAPAR